MERGSSVRDSIDVFDSLVESAFLLSIQGLEFTQTILRIRNLPSQYPQQRQALAYLQTQEM